MNETLFRSDGTFPINNNKYPLMKCGCVSHATHNGNPACVIHDCFEVERYVDGNYGLEGRKAMCVYRHYSETSNIPNTTDSHWSLPFFSYRPNEEYDEFYCGCMGWD